MLEVPGSCPPHALYHIKVLSSVHPIMERIQLTSSFYLFLFPLSCVCERVLHVYVCFHVCGHVYMWVHTCLLILAEA